MQLNSGITHCIDCSRSLSADKVRLHRVKFNIPRCRDCYKTKIANYCQYFQKDGKQCRSKADYGECYCSFHVELPEHLRCKYKPRSAPGKQRQKCDDNHRKNRQKSSRANQEIPDPCVDDLIPESQTRLYRIIGIGVGSSTQQIRAAYLRKARELHPDKNIGVNTTKEFQILQAAYDMITKMVSSS